MRCPILPKLQPINLHERAQEALNSDRDYWSQARKIARLMGKLREVRIEIFSAYPASYQNIRRRNHYEVPGAGWEAMRFDIETLWPGSARLDWDDFEFESDVHLVADKCVGVVVLTRKGM